MPRWRGPLIAMVLTALAAHFAVLFALPALVMDEIMRRTAADGGVNQMAFAARPDAAWRTIVRPSPDFLYAVCAFDIGAGAVRVTAPRIPGTYTSVALYADNTDNFYIANDTATEGPTVGVVIARAGGALVSDGLPVAISPSARGLVLVRVLVGHDPALIARAEARRDARCEPVG